MIDFALPLRAILFHCRICRVIARFSNSSFSGSGSSWNSCRLLRGLPRRSSRGLFSHRRRLSTASKGRGGNDGEKKETNKLCILFGKRGDSKIYFLLRVNSFASK